MTAGSDMSSDPTQLSSEERELAQRLTRLGPHGEPSSALDARILAAAHAAGARARPRRQRQRWPLAFGVAASLALALGVAWRLRPLPEPAPSYRSQTVSAIESLPAPSADTAHALEDETANAGNAAASIAPPVTAPAAARRMQPASPQSPHPEAFPQSVPPPPPPSPVPSEKSPMVFDAGAPPPPPEAGVPAPVAGAMAPSRKPQTGAPAAAVGEMSQRASQSNERSAGPPVDTGLPADALAEEDVPPATADAPEVRDAWLQRIRELAAVGRFDDARASLREFIRRWPDYPLPPDLRALGQ